MAGICTSNVVSPDGATATTLSGVFAHPVKVVVAVPSGRVPVPVAVTRAAWFCARLPADECTGTPAAATVSPAWATAPRWKAGSLSKAMSSVMTSAPAATSALRLAMWAAVPPPVALNASAAPGATSWTISSIAVPSSPVPAARTFTAGSSAAAAARFVTPSEITPTVTPVPSMPRACTSSARCSATPWLFTALVGWSSGVPYPGAVTATTQGSAATASTCAAGSQTCTMPTGTPRVPGSATSAVVRAPSARRSRRSAAPSGPAACTSSSTSPAALARTSALPALAPERPAPRSRATSCDTCRRTSATFDGRGPAVTGGAPGPGAVCAVAGTTSDEAHSPVTASAQSRERRASMIPPGSCAAQASGPTPLEAHPPEPGR